MIKALKKATLLEREIFGLQSVIKLHSLKHDGKLYDVQSDYQRVEIYNTHAYGNMLT